MYIVRGISGGNMKGEVETALCLDAADSVEVVVVGGEVQHVDGIVVLALGECNAIPLAIVASSFDEG